jgi:hypothetical protein
MPAMSVLIRQVGWWDPAKRHVFTGQRLEHSCVCGLLGELLGHTHPVILAYGRFMRVCDRMEPQLESELDHVYGRRLRLALVVFNVQLSLHNWYKLQLDFQERGTIEPPDVCQGMHMLKVQNNLRWLPTVMNVPNLLALCDTVRASSSSSGTSSSGFGSTVSHGGPSEGQPSPLQPQASRVATQAHQFKIQAATPGTLSILPLSALLKGELFPKPSPRPVVTLHMLFKMEAVSEIMCRGMHVGSAFSFVNDLQIMFLTSGEKELISTRGVTRRMREKPAGCIYLHLPLSMCPRAVTMRSAS